MTDMTVYLMCFAGQSCLMRGVCHIYSLCGQHWAEHSLFRRWDILPVLKDVAFIVSRVPGCAEWGTHTRTSTWRRWCACTFYRWRPKRKCGESGYPTVRS